MIGKIALALSGGGYRAAAFHLGTLHTLHVAGLLRDLRERLAEIWNRLCAAVPPSEQPHSAEVKA